MRENLLRGDVRVGAGGVGQNADGVGGSRGFTGGTGFGATTRPFRRVKSRNCGSVPQSTYFPSESSTKV